jgi:hypothetical protein
MKPTQKRCANNRLGHAEFGLANLSAAKSANGIVHRCLTGFIALTLSSCVSDPPGAPLVESAPPANTGLSPDAGRTDPERTDPERPVSVRTYAFNDGPDLNPHKGWSTVRKNNWPESTVGFQYLSWREFEPKQDQFDFAKVEELINRPGTAGRHFTMRLYCDWKSNSEQSECPDWLYTDVGVKRIRSNGTSVTDYNDPKYVLEAVQAIQALAKQYDSDPRVHAFQLGVLGFFGEWHTSGLDPKGFYTISDATKNAILTAYKTSFTKAPLQGRYPWREPLLSSGGIGFHNDYFVPNNKHSDSFDQALEDGGQWRNGPIGGEVPPRDTEQIKAAEREALFNTPAGTNMIATGRYSTMDPGSYRVEVGGLHYAGYMRLHRAMGYNFQIQNATFPGSVLAATMPVTILAKNIGVAPFYYPWTTQIALLNAQGQPVAQGNADHQLMTTMPGTSFTLSQRLNLAGVLAGKYRVAIRIIQPGADLPKASPWKLTARNTYILFANEVPTVDGSWASNNSLQGGWSILGAVTVGAAK